MKPRHQVSKAAIELIQRFEGYRRKSAQLADGRWTIGYGHTLTARQGAEVSESDAEALLIYDLINVAHVINENTYAPLTQNQFDGLCCFAFNIGVENFKRSAVLRRINEGQLLQAACAMELWRKADFEGERIVIDALVRRRSAEKTLFLTPVDGWLPAPSPVLPPKIDVDSLGIVPTVAPTVLTTAMDGDQAVARREPPAPAQPEAPPPTTASEIAVVAISAQLSQLLSEPDVAPEAVAADPTPSETPEIEPVAEPEPAPEPQAYIPEPEPTPERTPDAPVAEPMLDVPPIPVEDVEHQTESPAAEAVAEPEAEVPAPLPGYAVAGQHDFALTPPSDADRPAEPQHDPFTLAAETEAEPEPELFDPAREPAAPAPSTDLIRVEPVRTLAESNPSPRLLIDDTVFDPVNTFDATFADTARPFSLRTVAPLLLLALLGLAFFAGGIFWGFAAGDGRGGFGDPMTLLGWGLGILGIACFGGAIYLLLNRLVGEESGES